MRIKRAYFAAPIQRRPGTSGSLTMSRRAASRARANRSLGRRRLSSTVVQQRPVHHDRGRQTKPGERGERPVVQVVEARWAVDQRLPQRCALQERPWLRLQPGCQSERRRDLQREISVGPCRCDERRRTADLLLLPGKGRRHTPLRLGAVEACELPELDLAPGVSIGIQMEEAVANRLDRPLLLSATELPDGIGPHLVERDDLPVIERPRTGGHVEDAPAPVKGPPEAPHPASLTAVSLCLLLQLLLCGPREVIETHHPDRRERHERVPGHLDQERRKSLQQHRDRQPPP